MKFEKKKIGVLGGGQLGRMMLPPANYLDIFIATLDPNPEASCAELANEFVVGDFNDYNTVLEFGRTVDIVTIEIEHVNVEALHQLEKEGKEVYPQAKVIELIQDKRKQKQFYKDNAIPTSEFVLINSKEELSNYKNFYPAFQKLGKGGYDGGGVQYIKSIDNVGDGFEGDSLIEKAVDFEKEISIITTRNKAGQIECFPTVEMVFHPEHNLVDYLISPAEISPEIEMKAREIAIQVTEALGIVGILAVEMFVTKDGEIIVNECAPRPHNSGHQTIHSSTISQFEQHLRAILNLPLMKPIAYKPSAMVNLLGNMGESGKAVCYGFQEALAEEGIHIVLYGKKETKPARKMGHATLIANSKEELIKKIDFVKETIKIGI